VAAFSPSWVSEIASLTPSRSRLRRVRENPVQKVSASEAPIARYASAGAGEPRMLTEGPLGYLPVSNRSINCFTVGINPFE